MMVALALCLLMILVPIYSAGQDAGTKTSHETIETFTGQTLFIPAYSEIYFLKNPRKVAREFLKVPIAFCRKPAVTRVA